MSARGRMLKLILVSKHFVSMKSGQLCSGPARSPEHNTTNGAKLSRDLKRNGKIQSKSGDSLNISLVLSRGKPVKGPWNINGKMALKNILFLLNFLLLLALTFIKSSCNMYTIKILDFLRDAPSLFEYVPSYHHLSIHCDKRFSIEQLFIISLQTLSWLHFWYNW